jgi:hypothetical protein
MGAHIFLVGEDNFQLCAKRGVYGCVMPGSERNRAEVVAGVLSIRPDDLVFFYVKNQGVYGLWRVSGEPYFDETKVWDSDEQLFPFRFSFVPAVGQFSHPVLLNDVLDLRDKGRIWTFDLNPVQQKNQYKITMAEARELLRLLLRNNPIRQASVAIPDAYVPKSKKNIEVDLSSSEPPRVRYEGWLNAWFMQSLARSELKGILGDYQEFLNLVPTTFNKVMDVFLTHVASIDSLEVVYKYTCIELKTERATEEDLSQLLRYEDWLARKLAGGDKDMVQSILVANRFSDLAIEYVNRRRSIEEKTLRLITYAVQDDLRGIALQEVVSSP